MGKTKFIELAHGEPISILYEDRAVLTIDKPPGWMLVPFSWQRTAFNLHAALVSSITAGDFWARSRNIKFLKYIHRLDAETTGVLLFGKSPGAVRSLGTLFETRQMRKVYLAVVSGKPPKDEWTCEAAIGPSQEHGLMRIDSRHGKPAETRFHVLSRADRTTLLAAYPVTGRTHQIRLHLAHANVPVLGDLSYGPKSKKTNSGLGLRSIRLAYRDPFSGNPVDIRAETAQFLKEFGFDRTGLPDLDLYDGE